MGSQVPELVTLGTNRPSTRLCDTRAVAVEREKKAPKGLEGVVATTTAVSSAGQLLSNAATDRGASGKPEYERSRFLLNGELRTKTSFATSKPAFQAGPYTRSRETLQQMSETERHGLLRTVIRIGVEDPAGGDTRARRYRKPSATASSRRSSPPTSGGGVASSPVPPDPNTRARRELRRRRADDAHPRAAEILNACFTSSGTASRVDVRRPHQGCDLADMHAASPPASRSQGIADGARPTGRESSTRRDGRHVDDGSRRRSVEVKFSGFGHRGNKTRPASEVPPKVRAGPRDELEGTKYFESRTLVAASPTPASMRGEAESDPLTSNYAAKTYTFLGSADLGTSISRWVHGRWCAPNHGTARRHG